MRDLQILCAALLLLASTLGVPFHAVTGHGMAHAGGTTAQVSPAHVHDHGKGKCCPDHHKAASAALCQLACGAAVAVLDAPQRLGTQIAYVVRFPAGPPVAAHGATVVPDPFPPRPSRIA